MNRIRAFQESRALLTAIELDLFNAIGPGATTAEVASRLHTDQRATEMLMNALVALEMLEKKDGVHRNTRLAAEEKMRGRVRLRFQTEKEKRLGDEGGADARAVRKAGGLEPRNLALVPES